MYDAPDALAFNLAVLNGVHLNNTLRKLTVIIIRVYGNDETLLNCEIEKLLNRKQDKAVVNLKY